jgi:N-acetyltransferase 10
MGYGQRALQLLREYYECRHVTLDERAPVSTTLNNVFTPADGDETAPIVPRAHLPALLARLGERAPESLNYLGTSFGVTLPLLRFWKRAGYAPVYLRQTQNDLTGEHSCIMLRRLNDDEDEGLTVIVKQRHLCTGGEQQHRQSVPNWLHTYACDFRRRLINLLGCREFAAYRAELPLSMMQLPKQLRAAADSASLPLGRDELRMHLTDADLRRLEVYTSNMCDHHLITDLVPTIARLYFMQRFDTVGSDDAGAAQVRCCCARTCILLPSRCD